MGIKISELNQLETPVDSDIIPIVDMDAGETKYIEFADLLGPEGPAGPAGADGEEVTIRVDGGYIQWRLGDGEWENLIAVSSLVGPQGEQGIQGPEGPAATLNWMGAWSALTEYDPLDVVSHEGVTYLCIATSTDDEPPDPVHWNAIGAGSLDADLLNRLASLMNDTVAKGAPRAQDTPDMTIYVAGFQAYINGALVSFAGGNSPAMSAPSANPRIDRVYLTDAGALAITTGDEGASPEVPALVAGTVPICLIYHRVGSVHIDDADDSTNSYIYRDDRPIFQDVTASDVVGPASSVDERIARFNGITGKVIEDSGKLITDFADATHATRHKSGGADAIKLDELAAPTDVSTLNASTSAHGLLKKLSNVPTEFMNGQGNWATPSGTALPVFVFTGTTGAELSAFITTNGAGVYYLTNAISITTELDITQDHLIFIGKNQSTWANDGGTFNIEMDSGVGIYINANYVHFRDCSFICGTRASQRPSSTVTMVKVGPSSGDKFHNAFEHCEWLVGSGIGVLWQRCFYQGHIKDYYMSAETDGYGTGLKVAYDGCPYLYNGMMAGFDKGIHCVHGGCYGTTNYIIDGNYCVYLDPDADNHVVDFQHHILTGDYAGICGFYTTGNYQVRRIRLMQCHFWNDNGVTGPTMRLSNVQDFHMTEGYAGGSGSQTSPVVDMISNCDRVKFIENIIESQANVVGINVQNSSTNKNLDICHNDIYNLSGSMTTAISVGDNADYYKIKDNSVEGAVSAATSATEIVSDNIAIG